MIMLARALKNHLTMAGAAGGFILGYFWRDLFGAEAMRQRSGKAKGRTHWPRGTDGEWGNRASQA